MRTISGGFLKKFEIAFKALGEPSRLRILKVLSEREFCVCELEEILEMSQPRVSQHLRVLKHAGLVTERREKQWCFYAANRTALEECLRDFQRFLEQPIKDCPEFAEELRRMETLETNSEVRSCRERQVSKSD